MRSGLAYQKKFLLDIIGVMEYSEMAVVALIAQTGFPKPALTRKRRSLKQVAVALVFVIRARRASEQWREQSAAKHAVAAALEDVRRKRVTAEREW